MAVSIPLNGGLFKNVVAVEVVYRDRWGRTFSNQLTCPSYLQIIDIKIIRKEEHSLVN